MSKVVAILAIIAIPAFAYGQENPPAVDTSELTENPYEPGRATQRLSQTWEDPSGNGPFLLGARLTPPSRAVFGWGMALSLIGSAAFTVGAGYGLMSAFSMSGGGTFAAMVTVGCIGFAAMITGIIMLIVHRVRKNRCRENDQCRRRVWPEEVQDATDP